MYWIFFVIFILTILVPDMIQQGHGFLPEEKLEEALIFTLGSIAFLTFIFKERQLNLEREEKEAKNKKLVQTGKDLVDSYSYIGQVNRKMDILMDVALGFSGGGMMDKKDENEAYRLIVNAAMFIMKSKVSALRFLNIENSRLEKNISLDDKHISVKNEELLKMEDGVNIKKFKNVFIVASSNKINNVRSFLIMEDGDENELNDPKNVEILKVLVSQGLFFYSLFANQCNHKFSNK